MIELKLVDTINGIKTYRQKWSNQRLPTQIFKSEHTDTNDRNTTYQHEWSKQNLKAQIINLYDRIKTDRLIKKLLTI